MKSHTRYVVGLDRKKNDTHPTPKRNTVMEENNIKQNLLNNSTNEYKIRHKEPTSPLCSFQQFYYQISLLEHNNLK